MKLTRSVVKKTIGFYIEDMTSPRIAAEIMDNQKKLVKELQTKFIEYFKTKEEVVNYFDWIMEEIENLNKYFKRTKGKGGRIPYSKVLGWANKEERLHSYLLDCGAEKKMGKNAPIPMAGVELTSNTNFVKDVVNFSLPLGDEDLDCLYIKGNTMFFYSMESHEVFVRVSNGKFMSFKMYKGLLGTKVKAIEIYQFVKSVEKPNDGMKAFLIYIRQKRAKIARRKS